MSKISGCVCVKDAIRLDYPFEECIQSLLPVCDEVVVCDGQSRDGTSDALRSMEISDQKIRVVWVNPWVEPLGDYDWHVKWLNFARKRLSHPIQLHLDADEILDDSCYDEVLKQARDNPEGCHWFRRHTFFKTPFLESKPGYLCGHLVVRMAPTSMAMVSDQPYPDGPEPEIRMKAGWPPDDHWGGKLRILHYGFLRNRDALNLKNLVMDARYGLRRVNDPGDGIEPFQGQHPVCMQEWMRWRGHEL